MKENMRGFKVLDKNGCTRINNIGMKINKWYKLRNPNNVNPTKYGYHFFTNFRDIFEFTLALPFDVYEIESKGVIKEIDNVYNFTKVVACSEIKLIRKLSDEEILNYLKENVDKLVNDESYRVRANLAKNGLALDKLVNDESECVRSYVLRNNYGWDQFVNDESLNIKRMLIRRKYALDIFVKDKDPRVRNEVAMFGKYLDILINDPDPTVQDTAKMVRDGKFKPLKFIGE